MRHSAPTCGGAYYLRVGACRRDASCERCSDCTGRNETRTCSETEPAHGLVKRAAALPCALWLHVRAAWRGASCGDARGRVHVGRSIGPRGE